MAFFVRSNFKISKIIHHEFPCFRIIISICERRDVNIKVWQFNYNSKVFVQYTVLVKCWLAPNCRSDKLFATIDGLTMITAIACLMLKFEKNRSIQNDRDEERKFGISTETQPKWAGNERHTNWYSMHVHRFHFNHLPNQMCILAFINRDGNVREHSRPTKRTNERSNVCTLCTSSERKSFFRSFCEQSFPIQNRTYFLVRKYTRQNKETKQFSSNCRVASQLYNCMD